MWNVCLATWHVCQTLSSLNNNYIFKSVVNLRRSIRDAYTFISIDSYLEISTYYLEISTY